MTWEWADRTTWRIEWHGRRSDGVTARVHRSTRGGGWLVSVSAAGWSVEARSEAGDAGSVWAMAERLALAVAGGGA